MGTGETSLHDSGHTPSSNREPGCGEPHVVSGVVAAALVAFGVVFLAELGDKSQLLAVGFGARFSIRQVVLGLALGYGTAGLMAVVVGGVLGAALPRRPIEIIGGAIFLLFGILAFRPERLESEGSSDASLTLKSSVVASIGLAILIAEMGDKTQIATAALASQASLVGTWIGATLGEVTSGLIGALAGSIIGDRISPRQLQVASALMFVTFGILMLLGLP